MKENWPKAFRAVLRDEGGFVNHPLDPGGMTNLGVTRKSYEDFLKRHVTEQEMRNLTPDLVEPFYKPYRRALAHGNQMPVSHRRISRSGMAPHSRSIRPACNLVQW